MSARNRQVIASYAVLGLLFAVLSAAVVTPPIRARSEHWRNIEDAIEIDRRSRQAIAEAEALAASDAWEIDESLLLMADTDALAAAELQQTIKALVEREGSALISTAFRRAEGDRPLLEIPVSVRLRASVNSLARLLEALEAARPRLFVTELSVQSRHRRGGELRDIQEELDVQLVVSGYLAAPDASP